MADYRVQQGECLSRIAARYGFHDWHVIYDHAKNAELRRRRPDPNVLQPGDIVYVPELQAKTVKLGTDRVHRFRVHRPTKILRLAIEDLAGNRLKGAAFTLTVGSEIYTGATNGDGILEQKVPIHAVSARVEVGGNAWNVSIGHLNPMDDTDDDGATGIQARLRNLGYDPGRVDGEVGPRTIAAIRAFQRDHHLKVDGICGPKTRAKLKEKHGC